MANAHLAREPSDVRRRRHRWCAFGQGGGRVAARGCADLRLGLGRRVAAGRSTRLRWEPGLLTATTAALARCGCPAARWPSFTVN